MAEPDPAFDTTHPSGHILFRSCRGGFLYDVTLTEDAMHSDAPTLAEAILLSADVSFLKAALEIRGEIVEMGQTASAALPTAEDFRVATERLLAHRLDRGDDRARV